MSAPTTPTAEAVARLTRYLDAVDESHRNPFQKSVSYMDQDAGTFAWEVFKVSDLRALLAAYADAARDRERMDWLESKARNDEAVTCGYAREDSEFDEWAGKDRHWPATYYVNDEAQSGQPFTTLRAAIDAARTGEAR